jgi:site-specific DNA-methyltransferase (adenine-specific)
MSEITLFCGDCLEIMPTLPAQSVDVVITDPPYNVGLDYSDGDRREDYKKWCEAWFFECMKISSFVVFTPGMVNLSMWYSIKEPFWIMSWHKSNQCSPSRLGGFNAWEPILVYGKPKRRIGHDAWSMPIGKQKDVGNHPCPKYLPFWQKMITDITQEGDTILDPFMGSGTTGVACVNTNRNFIGIEKDPTYFAIAEKRIKEAQAQLTLNL